MSKIRVLDKDYDEEYVIEKGKASIKKLRKALLIRGIIIFLAGAIMLIYTLATKPESLSVTLLVVYISAIVVGAILLVIAFIKRDPIKVGMEALKKEDVDFNQSKSVIYQTINPDKTVSVKNIDTVIQLQTSSMTFRFVKGKECSKIFGSNDVKNFELKVDDIEVYNSLEHHEENRVSDSISKDGKNKFVKLLTFASPRMGGLVNTMIDGKTTTTTKEHATKDVEVKKTHKIDHDYTFILRLNDVSYPTFVAKDITIEEAEELANMFDIIVSYKRNKEAPKVEEVKVEEPKKEERVDKFEEIKKYKELLDAGIINQEEFDVKKKELLG